MSLTVQLVPHGRPATAALAQCLAGWRGTDPLAPATVLVSRSWEGLSLRRLLASGEVGGGSGLANVAFTTLGRFAAEIGASRLAEAGTVWLTDTVLGAAVRAALRADAGVLAPVRDHPATERAVADAWRVLREASSPSRARLAAQGPRQATVVRLADDVSQRLVGFHDEHDAIAEALATLAEVGLPITTPLAVHLPARLTSRHEELLRALATYTTVHVLVGLVGDAEVDAPTITLAERLAGGSVTVPPVDERFGTRVCTTPTADTEVYVVLRDLAARLRAGIPLERVAITYAASSPYARLVTDACARADLPIVAPTTRALSQTVPGRALLSALAVSDTDWSPTALANLVATAPVHHEGAELSAATIDRVARRAGVVHSLDGWHEGIEALVAKASTEIDDAGGDDARAERLRRNIAQARSLQRFLDTLAAHLATPGRPDTWKGWTRWARDLLGFLVGPDATHDDWPSDELEALTTVRARLRELGSLDHLDPQPDAARFRRTITAALEAPAPQTARFGSGLLVGPISTVVGLDLDVLYVLGATDGALPGRAGDDALLPDDDRRAAGDDIPVLAARLDEHRHTWLAALATAPERILSQPRTDARDGRELRPARWLLDTLSHLLPEQSGGRTLYSRDLHDLTPTDVFRVVPSHIAAVRSTGDPISLDDLDVALLARAATGPEPLHEHWLSAANPSLGSAFAMRLARREGRYDRFEGRVRLESLPSPVDRDALSATTLETYGTCPRRYLLRNLLGLYVEDSPATLIEPEARTTGSIVHDVLEAFFRLQTDLPPEERRRPHEAWTGADHERLDELTDEVFADYERRGLTGHPLLWRTTAHRLRRDLHTMLRVDDAHRLREGATPEAVELAFGDDSADHLAVALSDGRHLRFRGRIDRVDRTTDGRTLVYDYKTGGAEPYREITTDPVKRGRLLQLPIYGLLAGQHTGDASVQAGYWFATQKGRFEAPTFPLDEERLGRFRAVLDTLVSGIETGDFPARPLDAAGGTRNGKAESMCTYCDQKPACPSTREATWEGIRHAPELQPLVEVLDHAWPPADEESA